MHERILLCVQTPELYKFNSSTYSLCEMSLYFLWQLHHASRCYTERVLPEDSLILSMRGRAPEDSHIIRGYDYMYKYLKLG